MAAGAPVLGARDGSQIGCADEPGRSARDAISRSELFGILYLLGIANALAALIFPAIHSEDVWQAFRQVRDIDVVLMASAVGIYLLRQSPHAPVECCDWLMAAAVAFLLLVPHRAASWIAVTGLALYAICRDRRSTTAVAAASVFFAIAASSFWGLVLVQTFASTLLAWDAALAAALLDVLTHGAVDRTGNVIVTSDQTTLFVMVWCSFVPNLLYGFLCWTVIARAVRPAWRPMDLLALLAVAGLILTTNTLRLALMGLSADTYEWVHGSVGGNVFNVGLLLVIAAIALRSAAPAASSLGHERSAPRGGEPVREGGELRRRDRRSLRAG
jgi:hypothetical protein